MFYFLSTTWSETFLKIYGRIYRMRRENVDNKLTDVDFFILKWINFREINVLWTHIHIKTKMYYKNYWKFIFYTKKILFWNNLWTIYFITFQLRLNKLQPQLRLLLILLHFIGHNVFFFFQLFVVNYLTDGYNKNLFL